MYTVYAQFLEARMVKKLALIGLIWSNEPLQLIQYMIHQNHSDVYSVRSISRGPNGKIHDTDQSAELDIQNSIKPVTTG
jgi:hypothetical protein